MKQSHSVVVKNYLKSITKKNQLLNLLDNVILSDKEYKIMKYSYINCKPNDIIADELSISVPTVSRHKKSAQNKIFNFLGLKE